MRPLYMVLNILIEGTDDKKADNLQPGKGLNLSMSGHRMRVRRCAFSWARCDKIQRSEFREYVQCKRSKRRQYDHPTTLLEDHTTEFFDSERLPWVAVRTFHV